MRRILSLAKQLKTQYPQKKIINQYRVRHLIARNMTSSSEEDKAKLATDTGEETIFDKIIRKEIPSTVVFEDDDVLAFRDVSPQAPTHILLIPKVRAGLTRISNAVESHQQILGKLMYTASVVAKQEKLDNGYRLVINDGVEGCQSVYHLHVHLIGGRQLTWPPG